MPHLGSASLAARATCHPWLQILIDDAIQLVDFSVLVGHRGQKDQHDAFLAGNSKLDWPNSKHNATPSQAFDFAPYPQDWSDKAPALARFTFVAGVIHGCARRRGIRIRFGWDWNRNLDPRDETFLDWGHVELDEPDTSAPIAPK